MFMSDHDKEITIQALQMASDEYRKTAEIHQLIADTMVGDPQQVTYFQDRARQAERIAMTLQMELDRG